MGSRRAGTGEACGTYMRRVAFGVGMGYFLKPMEALRRYLGPIRLGAGMALVVALCLPLGQCARDGSGNNGSGTHLVERSVATGLFPLPHDEILYTYAIMSVIGGGISWLSAAILVAFTWPLASVSFGARWMESRFSWIYNVVELLLSGGTGYVLCMLTAFDVWLYGAYVVAISIGLFAGTSLIFLACTIWALCRRLRGKRRGEDRHPPVVAGPVPSG